MASVSVRIDIGVLLRDGGLIDRDIERRAIRVESRAKILCPVDNGLLRNSISAERLSRPMAWEVVADTVYASWIHEGHRFDPRAGRIVFVIVGPRPFLADALPAAL